MKKKELRKCQVLVKSEEFADTWELTKEKYFFHHWITINDQPAALIESETGVISLISFKDIQFCD